MLRRLVIAGFAAALAAPAFTVTPASATVLFTCPHMDAGYMGLAPGLSNTKTAQTSGQGYFGISDPCSNGETAGVSWGTDFGYNAVTTFPPRPLNCPRDWAPQYPGLGGYPDQTPILFGPDGGPSAFDWHWNGAAGDSHGVFKVKAGSSSMYWRFVFNITSGPYAPPAGKKTKAKLLVKIWPYPGSSYTQCANDSSPVPFVSLDPVQGSELVVVQQV